MFFFSLSRFFFFFLFCASLPLSHPSSTSLPVSHHLNVFGNILEQKEHNEYFDCRRVDSDADFDIPGRMRAAVLHSG